MFGHELFSVDSQQPSLSLPPSTGADTTVETVEPAADPLACVKKVLEEAKTRGDDKTHTQLPVTLLSGFLGAGKTTLLKHILQNKQGLRVAVIVNDMADVNVDINLVKAQNSLQTGEKLIELSNGCICCTLREDLFTQLSELCSKPDDLDYVLIESSGISEPLPVAETFTFEVSSLSSSSSLSSLSSSLSSSSLSSHNNNECTYLITHEHFD